MTSNEPEIKSSGSKHLTFSSVLSSMLNYSTIG